MFRSRFLAFLSCLAVFASIAMPPHAYGQRLRQAAKSDQVLVGPCDCAADEILVDLTAAGAAQLSAVAAQYKLVPEPISAVGSPPTYRMRIDRGQTSETPLQIAAAMQGDTRIAQKETNRSVHLVEGDELPWTLGHSWAIGDRIRGNYQKQYLREQIRLNEAQAVSTGQGVTIAVLDTGIDATHPNFEGKLVPGYDFVDNDADPTEVGSLRTDRVFGHGTHVAGLIALTAPDAKIMPLRVLDRDGVGDLWRVKDALVWAANHGATIVNMSFGYPADLTPQSNTFLQDLFNGCDDVVVPGQQAFPEFNDHKLLIVAGAGNGGQIGNGASRIYPAAERGDTDDNLLSVGATTKLDQLAAFSTMANVVNRHNDRWVRVVAPGDAIMSTLPGGRFGAWSGTSMAAPIVAGVAALVRSAEPGLNLTETVQRIEETGYSWECSVPSRNITMETSRLDAYCAVTGNEACYAAPRRACPE
jgi:subtilisin family serine protease